MLRETRSDIYVVTIADKSMKKTTPKSDAALAAGVVARWQDDRVQRAPAESHPSPRQHHGPRDRQQPLVLYDVASGKAKDTYDPKVDVSAGNPHWTPDGSRVLFTTGDRACRAVYAYDVASGKLTRVVDKLLIGELSLSKDGRLAAYTLGSPNAPAEVYVSDLTFASPKKLTDINPQLGNIALGETEVITWKSTDGTPVEGILLKPVGYQAGRKYPLLVEAHGGPTGATNTAFKANWGSPGQVWAGQGWAVLYPNPRGSRRTTARSSRERTSWTGAAATTATS